MRDRTLAAARGVIPTILALGLALVGAAPPAAAQGGTPVAPAKSYATVAAICADCHEEAVGAFAGSAHGRAFAHGSAVATCESCHGDAAAHIEAGDGTGLVKPSDLTPAEVEQGCMQCHSGNAAQTHWKGSMHQRRGVGCLDCHSIHAAEAADSMVDAEMRTKACYQCHQDVRAEMNKVSHHPVREGKMTCMSCHDPHGSITSKNLRAASVNELCYDCHTEKRGPFLWEHAPVRENCMHCHTPHGSNHLKLQSTSVPYICQQCHSNTRHPGTLYDATRLPTLENPATGSNRLFNRACVDCHAAVHGSNHPSSPYLAH